MPDFTRRNRARSRLTASLPASASHALGVLSDKMRNIAQNANHWDVEFNGELYTIERSCGGPAPCVFDVGANEGRWAEQVLRLAPHAHVHCFEPVPGTFRRAEERLRVDPRVELNCAGLGTSSGDEVFNVAEESHELASKYDQDPHYTLLRTRPVSVRILRGDDYVSERAVSTIDLLKVDVEGMELEVLRGFDQSLRSGVVSVVQFEYGVGYIGARTYLRDVMTYLGDCGFTTYELRPRAWRPIEYHFSLEDFNPRNFVAVRDR